MQEGGSWGGGLEETAARRAMGSVWARETGKGLGEVEAESGGGGCEKVGTRQGAGAVYGDGS